MFIIKTDDAIYQIIEPNASLLNYSIQKRSNIDLLGSFILLTSPILSNNLWCSLASVVFKCTYFENFL